MFIILKFSTTYENSTYETSVQYIKYSWRDKQFNKLKIKN